MSNACAQYTYISHRVSIHPYGGRDFAQRNAPSKAQRLNGYAQRIHPCRGAHIMSEVGTMQVLILMFQCSAKKPVICRHVAY